MNAENSFPNESLQNLTINSSTGENSSTNNDDHLDSAACPQNKKIYPQHADNIAAPSSSSRNLMDLPPELILLIFSYLDARFTLRVLCQVCKFFNQLLSHEATWKTRFGLRWPKRDKKEDHDYVTRYMFRVLAIYL